MCYSRCVIISRCVTFRALRGQWVIPRPSYSSLTKHIRKYLDICLNDSMRDSIWTKLKVTARESINDGNIDSINDWINDWIGKREVVNQKARKSMCYYRSLKRIIACVTPAELKCIIDECVFLWGQCERLNCRRLNSLNFCVWIQVLQRGSKSLSWIQRYVFISSF